MKEGTAMTTLPRLLGAAALGLGLAMGSALAADMPEYLVPPPVVTTAPPIAANECAPFAFRRPVDHVWQPAQVAYILAARCDSRWRVFRRGTDLFVYYNGGSADRTDIRVLHVR
jgi:hypothetical protein